MTAGHQPGQQLVADGHTSFLDAVQSAILIVVLDTAAPNTRDEVACALWHGNGDARNRWYDKTHQIVVFSNGKAGIGEHPSSMASPQLALQTSCSSMSEQFSKQRMRKTPLMRGHG